MATATLLAYKKGSRKMTRAQLKSIPTPKATKTWTPVPHTVLLNKLEAALKIEKMKVTSQQYGVRAKGNELFGALTINYPMGGNTASAAIGIRTSNNKKLAIRICAGFHVFVCDNLAFNGEMIALSRKHTSELHIDMEMRNAVVMLKTHLRQLSTQISQLKTQKIEDEKAKVVIHDAFAKQVMPIHYFGEVSKAYFNPPHKEFNPRTMWSLHNAFTEAAKGMPMGKAMKATQRLGELFGLVAKG